MIVEMVQLQLNRWSCCCLVLLRSSTAAPEPVMAFLFFSVSIKVLTAVTSKDETYGTHHAMRYLNKLHITCHAVSPANKGKIPLSQKLKLIHFVLHLQAVIRCWLTPRYLVRFANWELLQCYTEICSLQFWDGGTHTHLSVPQECSQKWQRLWAGNAQLLEGLVGPYPIAAEQSQGVRCIYAMRREGPSP